MLHDPQTLIKAILSLWEVCPREGVSSKRDFRNWNFWHLINIITWNLTYHFLSLIFAINPHYHKTMLVFLCTPVLYVFHDINAICRHKPSIRLQLQICVSSSHNQFFSNTLSSLSQKDKFQISVQQTQHKLWYLFAHKNPFILNRILLVPFHEPYFLKIKIG